MRKFANRLFVTIGVMIFFTNNGWSQLAIPEFEDNATHYDSVSRALTLSYNSKYELSISVSSDLDLKHRRRYLVLAKDENSWITYLLIVKYKRGTLEEKSIRRKIIKNSQQECQAIFDSLVASRLFLLNDTAVRTQHKGTGIEERYMSISHGRSYQIAIQSPEKIRTLASLEPNRYSEWDPENTDKKYFIKCRDLMYSLIKE